MDARWPILRAEAARRGLENMEEDMFSRDLPIMFRRLTTALAALVLSAGLMSGLAQAQSKVTIAVGGSAAEQIDVFRCHQAFLPCNYCVVTTISEKSAIVENSDSRLLNRASRFCRIRSSGAFTSTLSKNVSITGHNSPILARRSS